MEDKIITEELARSEYSDRQKAALREVAAILIGTGIVQQPVGYTPPAPEMSADQVLHEWQSMVRGIRNRYALDLQTGKRGKADTARRILALANITHAVKEYERVGV
jgi:hypothetical protein